MTYITGNHFKDLYNITKEKGLKKALKFDWNKTKADLENLVLDVIGCAVAVPFAAYATYKVFYAERRKKSV